MAEGGKAMGKGGSGKAMANEDTGATREGTLGLIQQNVFFWGGGDFYCCPCFIQCPLPRLTALDLIMLNGAPAEAATDADSPTSAPTLANVTIVDPEEQEMAWYKWQIDEEEEECEEVEVEEEEMEEEKPLESEELKREAKKQMLQVKQELKEEPADKRRKVKSQGAFPLSWPKKAPPPPPPPTKPPGPPPLPKASDTDAPLATSSKASSLGQPAMPPSVPGPAMPPTSGEPPTPPTSGVEPPTPPTSGAEPAMAATSGPVPAMASGPAPAMAATSGPALAMASGPAPAMAATSGTAPAMAAPAMSSTSVPEPARPPSAKAKAIAAMAKPGYQPRGGYLNKCVAMAVAAARGDGDEVTRLIAVYSRDRNFKDAFEQSMAVTKFGAPDPKRMYQ